MEFPPRLLALVCGISDCPIEGSYNNTLPHGNGRLTIYIDVKDGVITIQPYTWVSSPAK